MRNLHASSNSTASGTPGSPFPTNAYVLQLLCGCIASNIRASKIGITVVYKYVSLCTYAPLEFKQEKRLENWNGLLRTTSSGIEWRSSTRRVELGDDADAAIARVLDEHADLLVRVHGARVVRALQHEGVDK